jgi:hypothetical protein
LPFPSFPHILFIVTQIRPHCTSIVHVTFLPFSSFPQIPPIVTQTRLKQP